MSQNWQKMGLFVVRIPRHSDVFTRHTVSPDWPKLFVFETTYGTRSQFRGRFLRSEIFYAATTFLWGFFFFGIFGDFFLENHKLVPKKNCDLQNFGRVTPPSPPSKSNTGVSDLKRSHRDLVEFDTFVFPIFWLLFEDFMGQTAF